MPNYNPETRIPYGVISIYSLSKWLYDEIEEMESPEMEEAFREYVREMLFEHLKDGTLSLGDLDVTDEEEAEDAITALSDNDARDLLDSIDLYAVQNFYDGLDEFDFRRFGEIDGIKVSAATLGGALLVWVEESPHIGWYAPCSPCIPGAGDLDTPDLDGIECYDVPPDWRYSDDD